MRNYCTLFDSNYIHKGLALYQSLVSVSDDFHLFVMAFDITCYSELKDFNLPHMTVVFLDEFETTELLEVKDSRTKAEYCWTCGPSVIFYFIQKYELESCTYLDADIMFFSSPEPIYAEISDHSTAITEHFTKDEIGGRFCVQFVYFKNDSFGIEALTWWRDCCIEWCFSRYEDGKFGDQKYLDFFPEKFQKVCILKNRGVGVAPWNAYQYDFSTFGKINHHSNLVDIIFYHFHGARIEFRGENLVLKSMTYNLSRDQEKNVYIPYLELIKSIYGIYFNQTVVDVLIERRSYFAHLYSKIKATFRNSKIVQFFYYKVLGVKH